MRSKIFVITKKKKKVVTVQVSHVKLDHVWLMNIVTGAEAEAITGDDVKSTLHQVGTPPGGERKPRMTHRGTHASQGHKTQSHYYALWSLGNEVNARGNSFRCSVAARVAVLTLISALIASLTGCHRGTCPHMQAYTPRTPPTLWRKALFGHYFCHR